MPQLGVTARDMPTLRRYHKNGISVAEACKRLDLRKYTVQSLYDLWDGKTKAAPAPAAADTAKDTPEIKKETPKKISAKDEFS